MASRPGGKLLVEFRSGGGSSRPCARAPSNALSSSEKAPGVGSAIHSSWAIIDQAIACQICDISLARSLFCIAENICFRG